MKKFIKVGLKYLIIYLVLILIFLIALVLSSKIPNKYINSNVQKSAEELYELNEKTIISYAGKDVVLFNFTDALMINTAYSIDTSSPLYSAMIARRNYIPEVTTKVYRDVKPSGVEAEGEAGEYQEDVFQTKELLNTVNGENIPSFEYARYWHGYLVFLRPLLLLFDYNVIRIMSAVIFAMLVFVLIYLIIKKINWIIGILFTISLLCVDVFIAGISLNAITPFYIAVIASIILIWKFDKLKDKFMLFFIVGAITVFLDLLTTPLITFGIPITLYFLILQKQEKIENKELMARYIKICVAWGIGYAVTIVLKWIMVDILYNREVIITSVQEFLFRAGKNSGLSSFEICGIILKYNYYEIGRIFVSIAVILSGIVFAVIANIKTKGTHKNSLVPYILTGIMPIAWYLVLSEHSLEHSFFTYRNLCIMIFNIGVAIYFSINNVKMKIDAK